MASKGLFVGIDRYDSPEINWLSCANRDATALHALFADTLGGETMLLTDKQATVAVIRERFEQLATCDPDDVVVMLFRGTVQRRMNWSDMIPILTTSQEQHSADDIRRVVLAHPVAATFDRAGLLLFWRHGRKGSAG